VCARRRFYTSEAIGSASEALRKVFGAATYADIPRAFSEHPDVHDIPKEVRDRGMPERLFNISMNDFVESMDRKTAIEDPPCECENRGVLVRVRHKDIKEDWCRSGLFATDGDHGLPTQLRVIIVVRLDLLRYAISAYGRFDDSFLANPQFLDASQTDIVHTYDLDHFREAVEDRIPRWRNQVDNIRALRACGIEPIVSAYEPFDDAGLPKAYVDGVVGRCARPALAQRFDAMNDTEIADVVSADHKHIHKVHSYRLSEYALNARALYNAFLEAKYPTFTDVAANAGLDVSTLTWL